MLRFHKMWTFFYDKITVKGNYNFFICTVLSINWCQKMNLLLSNCFCNCSRRYNIIDLGTGYFRYGKGSGFVCFSAIQKILIVCRAQVPGIAITGHQVIKVCSCHIKCPPVRIFHVLLCSFMRFCIHIY